MPGLDKTGPLGNGPMSGRAQGRCLSDRPGRQQEQGGFGQGRGRKRGNGFGCGMRQRFGRGAAFNQSQPLPINDETRDR